MRVYSTRFCDDSNVDYTVPADQVAVVRDISGIGLGAGGWQVAIAGAGYIAAGEVTENSAFHWEGRAVANAGEVIFANLAETSIVISGYLLSA